jgi:hypothetical protein
LAVPKYFNRRVILADPNGTNEASEIKDSLSVIF